LEDDLKNKKQYRPKKTSKEKWKTKSKKIIGGDLKKSGRQPKQNGRQLKLVFQMKERV
jgi:hypothetical protein